LRSMRRRLRALQGRCSYGALCGNMPALRRILPSNGGAWLDFTACNLGGTSNRMIIFPFCFGMDA
jgi:hypothetical protein